MFDLQFFSQINPIWIPDSHPIFIYNSVTNSRRYSNSNVVPWDKDRDKDTDMNKDRDRNRDMNREGWG
jgi:hypothetical protein